MHEIGYAEGILASVRDRARGRPVAAMRVRAGAWHRLDADSLQQAMTLVATGTEAADARVDLVTIAETSECRACGHRSESFESILVCPACGETEFERSGGDELTLESVTYAAPGVAEAAG